MIIDSHAHVTLPTEKQISMMEEAGVDKTVLFSSSIHPEKAEDLKALEKELSTLSNILAGGKNIKDRIKGIESSTRQLKDVIAANPSKFIGFGLVPLYLNYNETAEWVDKNVVKNGFYGLGEFSPKSGEVMKYMENIFKASAEFGGLPLWVHTFYPLNFHDIKELVQLAKKYSEVPLILGHAGGVNWIDTIKLAKENKNVYIDLSAAYTIWTPKMAIKELPLRTLFSSDAPHGSPKFYREMIESLDIDKNILEGVLGGNIENLLKL